MTGDSDAAGREGGLTDGRLSRRRVLAASGALTAGLAGCSNNGGNSNDGDDSGSETATETTGETTSETSASTTTTGTNAIESATFNPEEESVSVTLTDPQDVAEIHVKLPDGRSFETLDVEQETVTISLADTSTALPGGEYNVTALFNGETLGTATLSVERKLELTDVSTEAGNEHPTILATVANTGDVSSPFEEMDFTGDLSDTTSIVGHIYAVEPLGIGESTTVEIPFDAAGMEATRGYAFEGDVGCSGSGTVTFEVYDPRGGGDDILLDRRQATVTVGGSATDESRGRYACSDISFGSLSEASE